MFYLAMVRKDPNGSILPTTSSSSSSSTSSNHSAHSHSAHMSNHSHNHSNHSLPSASSGGHSTNGNHAISSSSSSDDRHSGNNAQFAPLNGNNNHNSSHHQSSSMYNHVKPLGYNVSKPIVTIQLSGTASASSSSRSNLRWQISTPSNNTISDRTYPLTYSLRLSNYSLCLS